MILQALVQLAEIEHLIGDPDFELKPVAWIVRLRSDGTIIHIEDNRKNLNEGKTDRKGKVLKAKWVGNNALIPLQGLRTSGDAEAFMVDKAEYVLGVDPSGARPEAKLLNRLKLFYGAVERCAADTSDEEVHAVAVFGRWLIELSLAERTALAPADWGPADLIMFRVGEGGEPVHLRPAVKAYWKKLRTPVVEDVTEGTVRNCLITGRPIKGEVPLFRLLKSVPGGTPSGVSLVSFNASAWESYGWKGNENAPVSRSAAEAAATALNRLLSSAPTNAAGDPLHIRRIRLSEDTVVVFWSPSIQPEPQSFLDLIPDVLNPSDELEDVGNLFHAPNSGQIKALKDPASFFALTLTGTQGRVIVRDWMESTVADVQKRLLAHIQALKCVRNTPPVKGKSPRPTLALTELMTALAAPGRDAKVPAPLASGFVHAALRGTPYPRSILQRALLRERAEVTDGEWSRYVRRDARAALIKAVLSRDLEFNTQLEASMDETRTDPGYLLGRLMAVLEDTQRLASGGVNASIKDKFYGAASATPAAVFPNMMDLFHKHARKARDERRGAITIREKLVDKILSGLTEIPVHLDLKQQGLFVLGYHHQRYALFNKPDSSDSTNSRTSIVEGAIA